MNTTKSLGKLKKLRQDLQEDAGLDYPNDVMDQLLMLYDVCKCLDLNIFQVKDILGEVGWSAVNAYINSRDYVLVKQA